ncbi:MAG: hydroxyacid dehydrogenase [Pseudomonadota bacterium]
MSDIVITEFMDEGAVEALSADFDVLYDPTLADRQGEIPALLTQARALIVRNRTQVTVDLLAAASQLSCVGRLGVGLDNIDQTACAAAGVTVYPATGANDASVAEYVVTTALILRRGAYHATAAVVAGDWPRQALIGRELLGAQVGLIGFGSIARETARRFRALGAAVSAYDPFVAADDPAWAQESVAPLKLEALLSSADVISLHVPLTDATRDLIDTAALAQMKPDAVLINAARGGVVDEGAVATALKTGALGGAALDVFAAEPLSQEHGSVFADCPNLILTPHIAGVTAESNVRVSSLIAQKVSQHLFG